MFNKLDSLLFRAKYKNNSTVFHTELEFTEQIDIEGSRCNFEGGMCGWHNEDDNWMNWTLHSGPTETDHTGPSFDHTFRNATGRLKYFVYYDYFDI